MNTLNFLSAAILLISAVNCDNVPVVIWTNIKDSNCKHEGLYVPGESLVSVLDSEYLSCLMQTKPLQLRLLVTDKLSQNVLSNQQQLKSFMSQLSNAESYQAIPSVSVDSINVIEDIENIFNERYQTDVKVERLPINFEKMDEDLHTLDSKIAELFAGDAGNYIAILTGEQSLHHVESDSSEAKRHSKRQLLQAAVTKPKGPNYIDQSCIHMNFSSVNFTLNGASSVLKFKSSTAICTPPNANINLTFSQTTGADIVVKLGFKSKLYPVSAMNWWFLHSANVAVVNTTTKVLLNAKKLQEIYTAPSKWSWQCHTPDPIKTPPKATTTAQLQFTNLEIEVYNVTSGKTQTNVFGNRVDCSGFLTPGIWMGTLVSLLLLFIFWFGMMGIMSLSTMDRFDNPKGKMIQTHQKD